VCCKNVTFSVRSSRNVAWGVCAWKPDGGIDLIIPAVVGAGPLRAHPRRASRRRIPRSKHRRPEILPSHPRAGTSTLIHRGNSCPIGHALISCRVTHPVVRFWRRRRCRHRYRCWRGWLNSAGGPHGVPPARPALPWCRGRRRKCVRSRGLRRCERRPGAGRGGRSGGAWARVRQCRRGVWRGRRHARLRGRPCSRRWGQYKRGHLTRGNGRGRSHAAEGGSSWWAIVVVMTTIAAIAAKVDASACVAANCVVATAVAHVVVVTRVAGATVHRAARRLVERRHDIFAERIAAVAGVATSTIGRAGGRAVVGGGGLELLALVWRLGRVGGGR